MNKCCLILCLIPLVMSAAYTDSAVNKKNSQSPNNCVEYFPYDEDNDTFCCTTGGPSGASDCVDNQLYDKYDERYYDRCCFIRFQLKGLMYSGCFSLTEEQYMDIFEAMKGIEDGKRAYWLAPAGAKVYQLDCSSSYIKILSFTMALLALIF